MAFGNGLSKEEKKKQKEEERIRKFIDKYQLDGIDEKDLSILKTISGELSESGFFKTGILLSGIKTEEQAKIIYFNTLIEQNWVIIKNLSQLNTKLDKLLNK